MAAYDPADHVADAWRSPRLHYLRADPSDEHFRALVPLLEQDPVVQAHAAPTALQPKGPRQFADYAAAVAGSLLGVVICLRRQGAPSTAGGGGGGSSSNNNDDNDGSNSGVDEPGTPPTPAPQGTMIGVICLGWGGADPALAHHRTSHVGIALAAPFRGRGYGREAIDWMLDWAFRHAGLHSVAVSAASYNQRACRLYESVGFAREGRRRETIWMDRAWHDEIEFGITEHEWERLRGRPPSRPLLAADSAAP